MFGLVDRHGRRVRNPLVESVEARVETGVKWRCVRVVSTTLPNGVYACTTDARSRRRSILAARILQVRMVVLHSRRNQGLGKARSFAKVLHVLKSRRRRDIPWSRWWLSMNVSANPYTSHLSSTSESLVAYHRMIRTVTCNILRDTHGIA